MSGSRRVPAPIVLHASFDGRRLLLWAETPSQRDYAGLSGQGRRQRGTAPAPSPYDAWRPIAIGAASPFRLCFRLEEPEIVEAASDDESYASAVAADGPWRLRYLLKPVMIKASW